MKEFVTFASLEDGAYFIARGKFHCKSDVGVFQKPKGQTNVIYNAFYFDGPAGKWAHFNDIVLVQVYDVAIHGQPADIIHLQQAKALA
jgi:hypothetical protein